MLRWCLNQTTPLCFELQKQILLMLWAPKRIGLRRRRTARLRRRRGQRCG